MDTIVLPRVGDKCKAKYIPSVTGVAAREWTNDYIFTVNRVEPSYRWFQDGETKNGPAVWGDFISPTGSVTLYYVTEWEPVVETDIVEPPKSEEQQEIERLRAALVTEQERRGNERQAAIDAIQIIGQRLIDESNSRGWCAEFDRIISDVNEDLPSWLELPVRQREYVVTWTDYVSISVPRSTTVTAMNEEHAIALAAEDDYGCDNSDVIEAVRCGNWETTDSSDYEAEEE